MIAKMTRWAHSSWNWRSTTALRKLLKPPCTCQRPQLYINQVSSRSMLNWLSYRRDGQTDGRTDGFSALYSRLASLPAMSCRCMGITKQINFKLSLAWKTVIIGIRTGGPQGPWPPLAIKINPVKPLWPSRFECLFTPLTAMISLH